MRQRLPDIRPGDFEEKADLVRGQLIMAAITPAMIKDLRERTGVGMGKCKEALEEAKGDIDLAIANLRKAGMASAVKKEGRETKEGMIGIARNRWQS